jgi:glucuronoarabinoxylan endo-1,4-beta-xylanase
MKKLVFLFLCICTSICAIASAQTATINWTYQHQIIDGFGAADGGTSAIMSTAQQNFFFGTGSGQLGLSMLRAPIPNGGNTPGDCTSVGSSCAGPFVSDMQAVVANGGRVYASIWSPPAEYKTNDSTLCGSDAGLASGSYAAYATYFANHVQSLAALSIPLFAISVQNEPDFCPASYDGAVWSSANIDTWIKTNLGPTFSSDGINTLIFMPEDSGYGNMVATGATCGTDSSCTNYVGGYNWHDYDASEGSGNTFSPAPSPSSWASGKKYWETEVSNGNTFGPCGSTGNFDPSMTEALCWAGLVDQRMQDGANAWLYWEAVDQDHGSGVPTPDNQSLMANAASGFTVAQRAYMMGQYSKFVRPGYYRIDATHAPHSGVTISAYQNTSSGNLVIIATNQNSSSVSQTFNISNAPSFTSVTPTITSGSQSLATLSSVGVSGNSFSYTLPAQSIITFVGTGGGSGNDTLTVSTNGTGSGTVSGTDCSSGSYASGTYIGACTANPNSGSTFAGWAASGSTSCSGTGSCPQFDLTSTTNLTATFNSSNISLTVNKAGSGSGTIAGTNCSTGSYASGTQIGACTASANSGSTFAGWSASGSSSCSGTGSCAQFSLTSTTTLQATFNTTGGGGTPAYIQAAVAPGAYSTNPSTSISITPTAGDTLTLWVVSEGSISSFNAPTASGLTFTSQGTYIGSWAQGIWTATVPTTQSYTINLSANASTSEELTGIAVETSGTTTSGIVLSGFGASSGCPSCVGSTLTTTSANSMALTFMGYGYGPGLTVNSSSPFTLTSVNGLDSIQQYRGAGYYLKSSAGLYSPTWTTSNYPTMPNVSVALAASSGSTVTGVSASCSPTSITTSQTSQCSATVTGTGSPSQAVTWSVSSGSGSVNSSGLFTPSGTGTSTIKATSVQNSSYSGTANVTVTSSGGNPAYVQAVSAAGAYTTNPSTSVQITPHATGDTLTLWVASGSGITSYNTPTASGLTFTLQGSSVTSGQSQGVWTAPAPSTGTYTINFSANSSSSAALAGIVVETSGTSTSGVVLSGFGSTNDCESCSGQSLTTTSANSMVLTFMWYGIGMSGMTSPSPFAFTSVNGDDSSGMYNGAGYYLKSSTGLYSPTWTSSSYAQFEDVSVALAP